jgi:hypothetical protein
LLVIFGADDFHYWCHSNNTGVPDHASFPRRRESTPRTSGTERLTYWIPAFAGMTVPMSVRVSQMTPLPGFPVVNKTL